MLVASLITYAVAVRLGAAPTAAVRGPALRAGLDPDASALWLILVRALGSVPVGQLMTRARLPSVLAGALAAALIFCRLAARATSWSSSSRAVEIVAAVLAVATVALTGSFFSAATQAGPSAVGAALALGTLVLAERVSRDSSDGPAGLALALTTGLAAGGPLASAALGWPLGLGLVLWALRRGERWPLLAPVVFVAGCGASLLLLFLLRAPGPLTLGELGRHLLLSPIVRSVERLSAHALGAALAELVEQVGILGVLAGGIGILTLAVAERRADRDPGRALAFTLWPLVVGLVLRAASGSGPDGTVGMIAAVAALAFPLAVGIVRLADRLGRARLPGAAAIGVIIAVWPLLAR